VIDSGPGIAAAERERVFDPFHRLDGASGEGSGLGLAIARDAAARLGGEVSLHDRGTGTGLVFRYRQKRSP
jgi:two-component system OmpR family sensor kinase